MGLAAGLRGRFLRTTCSHFTVGWSWHRVRAWEMVAFLLLSVIFDTRCAIRTENREVRAEAVFTVADQIHTHIYPPPQHPSLGGRLRRVKGIQFPRCKWGEQSKKDCC